MTDRTPKDDLKDGLGLLFRAAKGVAKDLTPEKAEKVMYEGGNELVRVLSKVGKTMGDELSKAFHEEETSRVEHPHDAKPAPEAAEATDEAGKAAETKGSEPPPGEATKTSEPPPPEADAKKT